ncbi:ABC transporter ATP-binding protein [Polycladidibacter hongkongensis]|uniref:ABC transporter ATP-binding protein n=1 Tax=Polycladidibacter hongkongensis TaxID=1647556 RepID=UPI000837A559|nr:ABC transporter ATP-binding protein [Pseudovibrio hongkongensis]
MFKDFAALYAPHKRLFALDFGSAILSALLELFFPVAVIWFMDTLLPQKDWSLIWQASLALALLYAVNTALRFCVDYYGHMLGMAIETRLRANAFAHLQTLSVGFFDNTKSGVLAGRLVKDFDQIGEFAHHGPEDVFIILITFLGSLALMFYASPQLALITAILAPLIVWSALIYGRRFEAIWRSLFDTVGSLTARIEDYVGGIRLVKSFGNQRFEEQRFDKDNQKFREARERGIANISISMGCIYAGTRAMQIIVLLVGGWQVVEGQITNGELVGFLLLVGVFIRPLEKIGTVMESFTNGITGFKRYREFLQIQPDIIDKPQAIAMPAPRRSIRFEHVAFQYGQENSTAPAVLEDINLDIPIGKTTAFVGASGAGKSTICALLPRFYDVSAGSITFDGTDLRQVSQSSLRDHIGIVEQSAFLFSGTLGENIAYGSLEATPDDILSAAQKANLKELVDELPDGLDTLVGERGVKLSGGQRQRVSIARMFLKNPRIVILDEATSALDSKAEQLIQNALSKLSKGRTTLVIAHRLATIKAADQIVVMDKGRVVELGRHPELMQKQGIYHSLVEAQSLSSPLLV